MLAIMNDDIATRIQQRLEALGLSARAASMEATGNDSAIKQILNGRTANPRIDTLRKIAKVLKTTPEWLLTGQQPDDEVRLAPEILAPDSRNSPATVPVLGTASGSLISANGEGQQFEGFVIDSAPIQYARLPYGLAGQTGIYAFLIVGDSMWPMHPQGDIRFAQPHRPPAIGDTVVVQTRHWEHDPGQAYIKIYRGRRNGRYILEQINPVVTLEIEDRFVTACHRVVPNNELFGM